MLTWNVGSKPPKEDFRQLLGLNTDASKADIYAFGYEFDSPLTIVTGLNLVVKKPRSVHKTSYWKNHGSGA